MIARVVGKGAAGIVGLFLIAIGSMNAGNSSLTTGLEGEIRIGPTHGGPARLGVQDLKPLGKTSFVVKRDGKIIASFETDDEGRFRISLPPGEYAVSKKDWNGVPGNYGPFKVEIVAGHVTKVQWDCDSGMD